MEIRFYTLPSGGCPVEDYLDCLDARARDKTLRSIMLLREYGALLREPDSKHLEYGIFELRTAVGGYAGRMLYFFRDGGTAVLTHGFAKRGRKTPRREIERAKRYRSDDLGREGFA